jgi:hypothetical protein
MPKLKKRPRSPSAVRVGSPKLKKRPRGPAAVSVGPETEYTDYHGANHLFGLRRGLLYHLWEIGAIKSISLKDEGETRGKRLFHVPSIRQYLNSKLGGQQ